MEIEHKTINLKKSVIIAEGVFMGVSAIAIMVLLHQNAYLQGYHRRLVEEMIEKSEELVKDSVDLINILQNSQILQNVQNNLNE